MFYKVDDVISIISGKYAGMQGIILMSWEAKEPRSYMIEVVIEKKDLVLLSPNDFVPFNGDNEMYADRILSLMDDYR